MVVKMLTSLLTNVANKDLISDFDLQKDQDKLLPVDDGASASGHQSSTSRNVKRISKRNISFKSPGLPSKKTFFSRVTNIELDVAKFTNEPLGQRVRKLLDRDMIEYFSNPWSYLAKKCFPGQGTNIKEREMNEAAKKVVAEKNFHALNYKALEHPELPGWIIKGNSSQVSRIKNAQGLTGNNRFDHLNRVRMAQILREAAEEEGLLFGFPETYLIDTQIESDDPEKRYILIQEKIPILNSQELIALFQKMPYEQQQRYAEHMCRLIAKTGYADAHLGNMTLHNGKFYIFDEEPMGLLIDQRDTTPAYNRTLDECAAIGLQRVIDEVGQQLPIFRVAAENALIELREKWVDTPTHRHIFHDFIAILQNAQATTEARIQQFRKLDPLLQKFLGLMVDQSLQMVNEKEREKLSEKQRQKLGIARILEQPEILTFLSTRSGINLLQQIDTRYQFQDAIEALEALKSILMQENPSLRKARECYERLRKNPVGKIVLETKIFSLVESIKQKNQGISDKALLKELSVELLHTKTPGSSQCLIDDMIGMLRFTKRDFSFEIMRWRFTRAYDPRFGALSDPTPAQPVPKEGVLAERFPHDQAGKKLGILMVAYECAKFGLKFGGLSEAVYGMAKGFAHEGHRVTILTPKFDKLPDAIKQQMTEIETVEHPYLSSTKKDRVLGFEQEGLSIRYLEDTRTDDQAVDHYSVPDPKQIYVDGVLVKPDEPWYGLKRRMAYFSSSVAEYIAQHKDDLDVTLCHDWHSAYAVNRIAYRYFNAWSQGKMPAFVFVIHNNNYGCQGIYSGKTGKLLEMFGDKRPGMNVMLDAMELSDQVVTVSPSFAREIQQPNLGAGIDPWMRRIAHQDKLSGILNGSNPDIWNPADNEVLKNWVDPVTKESLPLSYSADDEDILAKKALIKEQLQKALEVYYPEAVKNNKLNVRDKDLILYVGRYDSSQKGLDKFKDVMNAAHEKDAAFVTMGIGEDPEASKILDELEESGQKLGNVWITRGKSDGFSVKMQMGDKEKGIPGLGPLFRAAAIYGFTPSSFEPCGLVQFESWLFGTLFIATATGGLADTVSRGPEEENFNGFTFERLADWHSEEQSKLVYETTLRAIDVWHSMSDKDKNAHMQKVMKDAQLSSWTSAPHGLSSIQQYERVAEKAIDVSKHKRGIKGTIDLLGIDEPKAVGQDHYFGEGSQKQLYGTFGAQITWEMGEKITGVRYRVMAPEARQVDLIVKEPLTEHIFDERRIPMKPSKDGSWEVFDNRSTKGTIYEYEIADKTGKIVRKADPFAFGSQLRPLHASVVADTASFEWSDDVWMEQREKLADVEKPVNIYEVHVGSWRRKSNGDFMNYREMGEELATYCKLTNYTHVELLGLFEHPSDSSWGYQASGYFTPTSRCGTFEDFQYLVNYLHNKGIAVIIDFVPYHFAPDDWGLREFGGVKFFENSDLYNGESPKWGTRVFDLGREDVRNFLLSSAHFFLSNHVDGLRVDAVSRLVSYVPQGTQLRWMPNKEGSHWNLDGIRFIRDLNNMTHSQFKGAITIAEDSRTLPYTKDDTAPIEEDGLGFDLRWNFEWMHKTLRLLQTGLSKRSHPFNKMVDTFKHHSQMKNVSAISHDEVVHSKGSIYDKPRGNPTEKFAQVRLTQSFKALFPSNGVLTFMGTEFGQKKEWSFERELDWESLGKKEHAQAFRASIAINAVYLENSPLWSAGTNLDRFEWIAIDSANYIIAFHRRDGKGNQIAIIHNFSRKSFKKYSFKFPNPESVKHLKSMQIVLNTDNRQFGGSGKFDGVKKAKINGRSSSRRGKRDGVKAVVKKPPKSFTVPVPALSTIVLKEKIGAHPD